MPDRILACLLLILTNGLSWASPLPKTKGPLRLTLRLDRREYVLHEPILIDLALTNESGKEIGLPEFRAIENFLRFTISPASGKSMEWACIWHPPEWNQLPLRRLGAGGSVYHFDLLQFVRDGSTLPPGNYTVKAVTHVGITKTKSREDLEFVSAASDPISFTIRRPTAEEKEDVSLVRRWCDDPNAGRWVYDEKRFTLLRDWSRSPRFHAFSCYAEVEAHRRWYLLEDPVHFKKPSDEEVRRFHALLSSPAASGRMKEFASLHLACCTYHPKRPGSALRTVEALRKVAADYPATYAAHLAQETIARMKPLADKERAKMRSANRP